MCIPFLARLCVGVIRLHSAVGARRPAKPGHRTLLGPGSQVACQPTFYSPRSAGDECQPAVVDCSDRADGQLERWLVVALGLRSSGGPGSGQLLAVLDDWGSYRPSSEPLRWRGKLIVSWEQFWGWGGSGSVMWMICRLCLEQVFLLL